MRTNWSVSVFCIGAFLLVAAFCVVVRPASAADEKCADLSVGKCSVTPQASPHFADVGVA